MPNAEILIIKVDLTRMGDLAAAKRISEAMMDLVADRNFEGHISLSADEQEDCSRPFTTDCGSFSIVQLSSNNPEELQHMVDKELERNA